MSHGILLKLGSSNPLFYQVLTNKLMKCKRCSYLRQINDYEMSIRTCKDEYSFGHCSKLKSSHSGVWKSQVRINKLYRIALSASNSFSFQAKKRFSRVWSAVQSGEPCLKSRSVTGLQENITSLTLLTSVKYELR